MSRSATAGLLLLEFPWLASLAGCARDRQAPISLSAIELQTVRAFAAQIIPSTPGSPGAEEAGAADFVGRALSLKGFEDLRPIVRSGMATLDDRASATYGKRSFASLSSGQQVAVMRAVEHEPFFSAARNLVVIGTLADPAHGGNHGRLGWKMLGVEYHASYEAPFGWYDTPGNSEPAHHSR